MTRAGRSAVGRPRAILRFTRLLAGLAVLCGGCASRPPAGFSYDRFPLDPRESIAGPLDESVEEGCRALAAGSTARAREDFARASSGNSARVAAIGTIEVFVLQGRAAEALTLCAAALAPETAKPTAALLSACGEAHARAGETAAALELYERAVEKAPGRPGLAERAEELRGLAADEALSAAMRSATQGRREAARREVADALALRPGSAGVLARAANVECEIGERDRALDLYRQALAIGGMDEADRERAAALALEVGDYAMAVPLYEELARVDPSFRERAAEARLGFQIDNWPDAERQAARARRVTRAGAARIVWWMFPEVREASVRSGVVATDVLERRDSRAVVRAVALGLLDVDPDTHRARPDASLTRGAAAEMMLRLGVFLGGAGRSGCLAGAEEAARAAPDAVRLATRCGLLSESGGTFVSGGELTRGLDRLRVLAPVGEAVNRD